MGTDLKIYEQSVTYVDNRRRIQLDEICTVWGSELIEEIMWKGQKNWYISSECGAEFELLGSEVLDFADKIKKYDKNFNDNQIDIDEWYRCEVSY